MPLFALVCLGQASQLKRKERNKRCILNKIYYLNLGILNTFQAQYGSIDAIIMVNRFLA